MGHPQAAPNASGYASAPAYPGYAGAPAYPSPPGSPWSIPSQRQQVGVSQGLNPFGATANPDAPPHSPVAFNAHLPAAPPAAAQQPAAWRQPLHDAPPLLGQAPLATLTSQRAGLDPEAVPENAPRSLAGFLVYFSGELGEFWPLYQGRNWIGRSGGPATDVAIDIAIDDPTISAKHALILASARPARLKLQDLESSNGTYVGRQRVEPGPRCELSDAQLLRFGNVTCIIKIV